MTISEIVKQSQDSGAVLIRYRANSHKETGTAQYDCKPMFTGSKKGWIALDVMTSGAILAVYNALNETQRAKFDNIPLGKLVDFCWKHVKAA